MFCVAMKYGLSTKMNAGNSELYSLEAFNERFDTRVDKAYLQGRYHAIPNFGVNIYND